ncbi:MAG: GAF domain-containing protein [Anaerolineae bacterium]|nr:GAF domain-containing protein [Anaerolineae bacterium]
MKKGSDTTINQPLNAQVVQLGRLAASVKLILKEKESSLPKSVVDGLKLTSDGLIALSKQISQQEEELTNLLALADMGQVINSSLELNEVLKIVMDTIVRLTGAERGFLMLKNEEGELEHRIARNWEQESLESDEFAISSTIVNRVTKDGDPVLTTNAQEDPRFGGQESIVAYNLRSILCVPLKVKDDLIGVIYADNRVRTGLFAESDRDLLMAFANQAAVALENARLFESVRRTLEEVTELKNLMDNVFSSIASGVMTADVGDTITLINVAAESILGREAEELVGERLDKDILPIADELSEHINNVRETEEAIIGLEITSSLPERGEIDLRFNLSPLKDHAQNTQGVAIVLDDMTEHNRLEGQRRLFEKMVSPAVIDQLDPDEVALGGKKVSITSMFADIRGFTSYSEKLDPEDVVSILNQYLKMAADAVLAEEGTIDKFMGDALMAWYNAPIPQKDHTLRAVKSAISIRDGIKTLHKELPKEAHLSFGAGIHYGDAVLGLVGTEVRIDYTAIGDSVNTAKRIQENSEAGQILISADAHKLVKTKVEVKEVDPVEAKGKSKPVKVFEVVGLKK